MRETIKKLFWISRPISWPNTAYPFAAGYLVTGGQIDVTFVLGTVFFLISYNLLMYGINDVFDYESDILNPRKGGIEGMREQRAFHPTIVWASLATSLPFVVYFLAIGSWWSRAVFAFVLFMVVAYSVAKLRFKERPFLDSITSSTHFVGPLLFALALNDFPSNVWPYVVAFFLWGVASHAFGAVQDIIPDRAGKIASIATVLGARPTVWFAAILYMVAAALVMLQGPWGIIVGIVGLAYVANVAPYLHVTDTSSPKTNAGWRRFIWLNFGTGFVVTIVLILARLA